MIDQLKLTNTLVALYAILGLSAPQIVFVDGPLAAINKAVEIGDERDKQTIRADLFVGSWRGYWFRRYGAGVQLDPEIFGDDKKELEHWLTLADEGHAFLMYEECVIVTERPEFIEVDSEGRLHHESHAALRERDGVEIYSWHGIEVPAVVIVAPETLTVDAIDSERNAEVRRIMIERFGQQRFLQESNAKVAHQDEWGTLYRKEIDGDEALVMVKVQNSTPEPDGSIKEYFIRVSPDCETAHEAVSWTFGKTVETYKPVVQT